MGEHKMQRELSTILTAVNEIAHKDVEGLDVAEKSYGNSWKQRVSGTE